MHSHSGFLVGEAGLEPARPQWTLEPESSESTNSTTRPYVGISPAQNIIAQKDDFVNGFFRILRERGMRRETLRVVEMMEDNR